MGACRMMCARATPVTQAMLQNLLGGGAAGKKGKDDD